MTKDYVEKEIEYTPEIFEMIHMYLDKREMPHTIENEDQAFMELLTRGIEEYSKECSNERMYCFYYASINGLLE